MIYFCLLARDVKLETSDLASPLAMAMGGSGGQYYDLLGVWALLWLVLTFVAWLGVTIHDLALIGQTQKDFILDVSGVNQHCPCIRAVCKVLAGYRPLLRLTSAQFPTRLMGLALATILAPAILAGSPSQFTIYSLPDSTFRRCGTWWSCSS